MTQRFHNYLRVSQSKVIVWGGFMIPYLLVMVWFSPLLPSALRQQLEKALYQLTVNLAPAGGMTGKSYSLLGNNSNNVGIEEMTLGYILVTYLWSCILVESFGTIHHNGKKGIFQNQSIHSGSKPSSSRRVRKTIRRHD